MDESKPHKGRLVCWFKEKYPDGYTIVGLHIDHLEFPEGHFIQTTRVVSIEGDQVETRNSRYTLIGDEKSYPEAIAYAIQHGLGQNADHDHSVH